VARPLSLDQCTWPADLTVGWVRQASAVGDGEEVDESIDLVGGDMDQ
jgi:hypothetical protein